MKAETYVIEKTITVKEYLESKGLDPTMYFVNLNDEVAKMDQVLNQNDTVKVIPIVAGG